MICLILLFSTTYTWHGTDHSCTLVCHTIATTKLSVLERKDQENTEEGDLDLNAHKFAKELQMPTNQREEDQVHPRNFFLIIFRQYPPNRSLPPSIFVFCPVLPKMLG